MYYVLSWMVKHLSFGIWGTQTEICLNFYISRRAHEMNPLPSVPHHQHLCVPGHTLYIFETCTFVNHIQNQGDPSLLSPPSHSSIITIHYDKVLFSLLFTKYWLSCTRSEMASMCLEFANRKSVAIM